MTANTASVEILINDKKKKVPQIWNELTRRQVIIVHYYLVHDVSALFAEQEILPYKRMIIMKELLGIDDTFLRNWEQQCIADDQDHGKTVFLAGLDELLQLTDFLFKITEEDGVKYYSVNPALTKCPWPVLRYKPKKGNKIAYHAPAEGMSNLSLQELGMVFTLYEDYLQTKDEEVLHELLAIIYRPAKPKTRENLAVDYQGDIRMPLIGAEHLVKKRQEYFRLLTKPVKQLLIFWIASCRQAYVERFPMVFNGKGEPSNFGFGGLIMSLAGELTKIDQVAATPAQDAMVYLSFLEEQRIKQKRKQKKETV
jgi:hypothetical protein